MVFGSIAHIVAAHGLRIEDAQIGALNLPGGRIVPTDGGWFVHFGEETAALQVVRNADGLCLSCVHASHEPFAANLADVAHCLRLTEALSSCARVQLVWTASRVAVDGSAAGVLLRRWAELKEPPTLWIVALELENVVDDCIEHRTCGLQPFVGHELKARFVGSRKSREAAQTLARVARHALISGPISPGLKLLGLYDQPLRLDWSGYDAAPNKMVTIQL